MWGALSDERTSVPFARVTVSSIKSVSVCRVYILHVIKSAFIQYIQGPWQTRLSIADHALYSVAPATTAA
jgi:hypothetical protein